MAERRVFSALNDWLSYLETLHPKAIDLGLTRIRAVAQTLGVVPSQRRTITVAGTNGKGTCVTTLQALLLAEGYTVGVYTSPHLIRFNERIALNGVAASDADILQAFAAIEDARGDITLSYFEFATLAALWLFQRDQVDWQILEVGLGGRLDAVNIVDADACVITSIGLDHTEWLGDTRDLIAPEKAGVARKGRPAVVAEADLPATLVPTLEAIGANTVVINRDWSVVNGVLTFPSGQQQPMVTPPGLQSGNVAAAVVVLETLGVALSAERLSETLSKVQVPGRQQRLVWAGRDWWFDVSHNRESVAALARAVGADSPPGVTHAVFGAMADKPLRDMIDSLRSTVDYWHLPAAADLPRAATPAHIHALLGDAAVSEYPDAGAAWRGVLAASQPGDRVLVFGSFVTVGAQLEQLEQERAGRETEN